MKTFLKTFWKHLDTVPDGCEFRIKGLNIWELNWEDTGEKIVVKDPLYGKDHSLTIWKIRKDDLSVRFAGGEFSNCMWGIYVEKKHFHSHK